MTAETRAKQGRDARVNRAGLALTTSAHVIDDIYQGIVPALMPFLVAERHYSFAAVAGLTTASTVLSSIAQPIFGWWADKSRRRWLIAAGIATAAVGIGLAGVFNNYVLTAIVLAISGLGIAAFHPEAARAARQSSGSNNRAMAVFALGGNAGFALGTVIATPVLVITGVKGTPLFIIPAAVMVVILMARLNTALDAPRVGGKARMPSGTDDWHAFTRLIFVVVVRAVFFFGLTTFVGLYFINHLGASASVGNAALTTFLVAGAVGTLLGGWVGDRFDRLASIRAGFVVCIPAMIGFVLVSNQVWAFVLIGVIGIGCYMPFAVFVMLGQDYLPNRIGTASGLTVGLAVTIGGFFSPLFGWLADHTSLRTMFVVLIAAPAIALLLSFLMDDPARRRPARASDAAAPVGSDTVSDS